MNMSANGVNLIFDWDVGSLHIVNYIINSLRAECTIIMNLLYSIICL